MARKAKAVAARPAAAAPRSLAWAQGLLCGALVAMAPALAVLLGVLAAPVWLGFALERAAGRPVLRCVALCTAAACVGPVRAFWSGGHGMGAALALVTDGRVVAATWGAGAAGWVLVELCPLGARLALEATTQARIVRLRARRTQLAKAWGMEA